MCTHCDITHYLVTVRPTLPSMTFNWCQPLQCSITLTIKFESDFTTNLCLKYKLDLTDLHNNARGKTPDLLRRNKRYFTRPQSTIYSKYRSALGSNILCCPWMFWELQYRKWTEYHPDNRRFPGQQLSWQTFTSLLLPVTASPYVYLYLPRYPLSISPPHWPEGVGGNGRDHYITKHPQATVHGNRHTRLPIHFPQTSRQVLCATLQVGGRGAGKEGKELREGEEGKEGQKQSITQQDQVHPQGQNHKCSRWTYLTFVSLWPRSCLLGHEKTAEGQRLCHLTAFFTEMRHLCLPGNDTTNAALLEQLHPINHWDEVELAVMSVGCYGILQTRDRTFTNTSFVVV